MRFCTYCVPQFKEVVIQSIPPQLFTVSLLNFPCSHRIFYFCCWPLSVREPASKNKIKEPFFSTEDCPRYFEPIIHLQTQTRSWKNQTFQMNLSYERCPDKQLHQKRSFCPKLICGNYNQAIYPENKYKYNYLHSSQPKQ